MNDFFSYQEGSLLVRLLIAHCLSDFFMQPASWVAHKKAHRWASPYLWLHGLVTGATAWLFLWDPNAWWVVAWLVFTHVVIDGLKLSLEARAGASERRGFYLFTIDQALHGIVIVTLWLALINGWRQMQVLLQWWLPHYRVLLRVLGYLLMIGPVGFFIQYLTRRWTKELNMRDSLKDAGRWIGMLERVLILTFVYANQFGALGFLIAAKSLLRITDRTDHHGEEASENPFSSRKHTEYVLIGTFLSFAIATITGLVINWLLSI